MRSVTREELLASPGKEYAPTEWLTITQEQIDQFAQCTLDHQFIHTDPVRAKSSPFGTTIAHGFLSLSLLSHFSEQYVEVIDDLAMGINYGFDHVRFVAPVPVDSRIRCRAKVVSVEEKKPGHFLTTTDVSIEIEGSEKPAVIATWLGMQIAS